MCTFRFKSRPKVWIAIKMPGVTFFLLAIFLIQLAAGFAIALSNGRLSQKKSHNSEGIVKVMCCQEVRGKIACCFSIQISVAFFPQDEQALFLQLKIICFM